MYIKKIIYLTFSWRFSFMKPVWRFGSTCGISHWIPYYNKKSSFIYTVFTWPIIVMNACYLNTVKWQIYLKHYQSYLFIASFFHETYRVIRKLKYNFSLYPYNLINLLKKNKHLVFSISIGNFIFLPFLNIAFILHVYMFT